MAHPRPSIDSLPSPPPPRGVYLIGTNSVWQTWNSYLIWVYLIGRKFVFGRLGRHRIHICFSNNSENGRLGSFGGPSEPSTSLSRRFRRLHRNPTFGDKNRIDATFKGNFTNCAMFASILLSFAERLLFSEFEFVELPPPPTHTHTRFLQSLLFSEFSRFKRIDQIHPLSMYEEKVFILISELFLF